MKKKFLFIGNRFNVLGKMREHGLKIVGILPLKDSYLEHELIAEKITFDRFVSREELINQIKSIDFDILVSNGCPYILPISKIKKPNQLFINIHPSLLPDLRGVNPINGAILFDRDAGVTCHLMDDGIDTGKIISQINLEKQQDLGLLYKMSFLAEGEVFVKAYERSFKPSQKKIKVTEPIYYTRKEGDMIINFNEDINSVVRRVRAFGIKSQGSYFNLNNKKITVLKADIIKNAFLVMEMQNRTIGEIVLKCENSIVIKHGNGLLLFSDIITGFDFLKIGDHLL